MKAISLYSGGLDSALVVKIAQAQGIEIVPVHFVIPFAKIIGGSELAAWKQKNETVLGIPIVMRDVSSEFMPLVERPRFGYGKHLNPCIDCKIFMLKKAHEYMREIGAQFIITGEVVGQRPKSQQRGTLVLIEKESGVNGLLVRPLSARLLAPTRAEENGWIDRTALYAISGRSRKPQQELARDFGMHTYAQPAGGCMLADGPFCRRLHDLLRHNEFTLERVQAVRLGRYFRLASGSILIVGRNQECNARIDEIAHTADIWLQPEGVPGPSALGFGCGTPEEISVAAGIVARYTVSEGAVSVVVRHKKYPSYTCRAVSMPPENVRSFMV